MYNQASLEFGIDKQRLIKWLREGRLRRLDPDVVGRIVHISRPELEKFLEDNMTTGAL